MIEWRAVVLYLPLLVMYLIYLVKKSDIPESETEPESITADTKTLIEELHRLTQQHTDLQQFMFDTEQEKDTTYSISYKTADNTTKTAEIIKAVDSTPYTSIRRLSESAQRLLVIFSDNCFIESIDEYFSERLSISSLTSSAILILSRSSTAL